MKEPPINALKAISFQPPGGHLFPWLLLGVALAAFAFWTYRRNPAPLSPGIRSLLWSLRALAFLVLLLLICRPVLSLGAGPAGRRALAVLFDTSESLSLPAGAAPGGPTRAQAALGALNELLPKLKGKFGLKLYAFDRQARPLSDDSRTLAGGDAVQPVGEVTALGPAVESAVAEIGRARAGAVVVLSDGGVNSGSDPLGVARRLGLPVYAVGVGQDSVAYDAAVVRLRVNRNAFLGDEVPLSVTVSAMGRGGATPELTLVDVTRPEREEVVLRQAVALAGGGAEQEVKLKFRPASVGQHLYELRLPEAPGEFTLLNNRRMFALDVREEKSRVLVLAGALTWETTFLKRVLDADSSLSVTPLARLGGGWRRLDAKKSSSAPPLDAAALGPYALVVLVDMSATDLPAAEWETMAAWVRRGGGLLVVGGGRSGGLGRLEGSAIASLLPVNPGSARPIGELPLAAALTAAGRRHPVTQVDEDDAQNAALWKDLPPLTVVSTEPVSRGAGELLVGGVQGAWPVLVAGHASGGKVLVAGAGGYWKWDFRVAGFTEKSDFYARLWTNAVRWLTSPDLANRLYVEPDQPVFERGDAVTFSARLSDRDYQPVDGAEIRVVVDRSSAPVGKAGADSSVSVTLTGGAGFYSGGVATAGGASLSPGRYRYHAEARLKGENGRGRSSALSAISCGGKRSSSRQSAIIRGRCRANISPIASQVRPSSSARSRVFFALAGVAELVAAIATGKLTENLDS